MSLFSSHTLSVALRITAFVNWGASAAALLQPELNFALLYGEEIPLTPMALRFHYLLWSTVLSMGLGYWVAAREPEHQSGLILAAGLGKIGVALVWSEMLLTGLGTTLLLAPISFDAVFGAYFLGHYYLQLRRRT